MSPSPDKFSMLESKKKRNSDWPEPVSGNASGNAPVDPNEALKHLFLKMRLRSVPNSGSITPYSESEPDSESFSTNPLPNFSSTLSDELLLKVFSKIPDEKQHLSNSLVCKKWLLLCGKMIQSVKLLDWDFLDSGRLSFRFPNLVDVNIAQAGIISERNSGILLSTKSLKAYVNSSVLECDGFFIKKEDIVSQEAIDKGVRVLAKGYPKLRRAVLMNVGEESLSYLGDECELLQELELHYCSDFALKGVHKFQNLQILKLIGRLNGVYESSVSDIGLTILAQGCRRLLKLELIGCEGSYDGIKAIGVCCPMLEELTLGDHRMEGGWLSALSYCGNLKTLRIQSCGVIDENPGPSEHIGFCPMLQELHLSLCHMGKKEGVLALFLVCRITRVLDIENCWGMDDSVFSGATVFRSIRSLSLEGCSLLTTEGLGLVLVSWKELDRLKVISCNNVKDSEITPELAELFSVLKELKWRPDSKSLLASSLVDTGIGQKGGRSLRRK